MVRNKVKIPASFRLTATSVSDTYNLFLLELQLRFFVFVNPLFYPSLNRGFGCFPDSDGFFTIERITENVGCCSSGMHVTWKGIKNVNVNGCGDTVRRTVIRFPACYVGRTVFRVPYHNAKTKTSSITLLSF